MHLRTSGEKLYNNFMDFEKETSCRRSYSQLHWGRMTSGVHSVVLYSISLLVSQKYLLETYVIVLVYFQEPRDLNLDADAEDRRRYGHLWFQRSTKFEAPRAIMHIHLWSPEMSGTKQRVILQRLFLYAIEQELSLVAYEGSIASMWYSVDFRLNGLLIHVSGFTEKLFLFYSTILKQILNKIPIKSDVQFQAYKGAVRKKIVNWLLDPHSLNSFTYSYLLEKDSYMVDDMLDALNKQSAADLMSFAQRIFQHIRLTAFVYGNITEQGDTAVYDPGTYHIRLFNTNPSDVNMCVTHVHILGRTDLKTGVFCNLIAYVLNEPAFDYLRTKEMLSYYVALQPWVYRDGGSAHQAILLVCRSQATKFSMDHVGGRMNAFWYRVAPRIIAAMTKQSFRTCVSCNVPNCMRPERII
ncbi:nardilysin [Paragonimus westermani]|uniref:Nardilysin n=1 Tax=Paragonimus westermani TaxID=34504 RepID=A0A5J4NGS0_9TREM|nr:nardilysin [Paragonimus westermani]